MPKDWCPLEPLCVADRKRKCTKPNPWLIFLEAHSQASTMPEHLKVKGSASAKSEAYQQRKSGGVLFTDQTGREIKATDVGGMCRAHRLIKNLVREVPLLDEACDELDVPSEGFGQAVNDWAENVVAKAQTQSAVMGAWDRALSRDLPAWREGSEVPMGLLVYRPGGLESRYAWLQEKWGFGHAKMFRRAEWFSDAIIDAFCSMLQPHAAKNGILIVSPVELTNLGERELKNQRAAMAGSLDRFKKDVAFKLGKKDQKPFLTLIPVNVGKSHWILFVYHHGLNKYYILDSMNKNRRAQLNNVKWFMRKAFANDDGHWKWHTPQKNDPCDQIQMPTQKDTFQCGVWVCCYVMCIALGLRLPSFLYADADQVIDKVIYSTNGNNNNNNGVVEGGDEYIDMEKNKKKITDTEQRRPTNREDDPNLQRKRADFIASFRLYIAKVLRTTSFGMSPGSRFQLERLFPPVPAVVSPPLPGPITNAGNNGTRNQTQTQRPGKGRDLDKSKPPKYIEIDQNDDAGPSNPSISIIKNKMVKEKAITTKAKNKKKEIIELDQTDDGIIELLDEKESKTKQTTPNMNQTLPAPRTKIPKIKIPKKFFGGSRKEDPIVID
jgi:Ulp1 protease family, C-terminal catalytic domain